MSFTYPAFLIALLAIAVPIIIHLFNFRKFKTVYFSNVRFLKEVKQETQAKSKLKHLLVLLCRILAITFLVLAFAQPFIPVENSKIAAGEKAISIFVDNSFSMDAMNANGSLLEEAKKKALEIVAAYKPSDRFQLLTNDFEGKQQRLLNKEEFIEMLEDVKVGPATRSFPEITSRSFDLLQQSEIVNKSLFILTDLQKSILQISQIRNDTNIRVNIVPSVATEKSNVFIDTCWFESPVRQVNQVEKLHVRIKNISEKVLENNSIRLFINDVQKTPASFSVDKGSETEIVLSFVSRETGLQNCRIELDDYPVTFDDAFYFSFEVAKNIPVLSISETETGSIYLSKLFDADSLFIYKNAPANKLDYSTLVTNRLIILNELKTISSGLSQELKRYMENGGNVLVFPSEAADLESYKEFLLLSSANYFESKDTFDTKVGQINLEHEIYKDVFEKKSLNASNLDLPKVFSHFVISRSSRSKEEGLLKLQDNTGFLCRYPVGKGRIYVCAVPLDPAQSNLVKHALFVPTMYKICLHSQENAPLFYTIGKDEFIETGKVLNGESVFRIRGKGSFDIIPEHQNINGRTDILLHSQIKEAGNYELWADKEKMGGLSFNFNRLESDLNCLNSDELRLELDKYNLNNINILNNSNSTLTNSLSELEEGKKLWKLCLILALLFLGLEVLLLRFMKG